MRWLLEGLGVQAKCCRDCSVWELTELTVCVCVCVSRGSKWETGVPLSATGQTESPYWMDPHYISIHKGFFPTSGLSACQRTEWGHCCCLCSCKHRICQNVLFYVTRHVPTGSTCPDLLLIGPGDMGVQLLTLADLSVSATPECLHVNLDETTHTESTFQMLLSCVGWWFSKAEWVPCISMTLTEAIMNNSKDASTSY